MKKIILILLVSLILLLLLVSYSELEQGEDLKGLAAFQSGNSYMKLEKMHKAYYLEGLLDGMASMHNHMRQLLEEEDSPLRLGDFPVVDLFKDMPISQIVAIFDKYLGEHPELWHYAASEIFSKCILELL